MKFISNFDKWIVLPSDLENTIRSHLPFDTLFEALALIHRYRDEYVASDDSDKLSAIKSALYEKLTQLETESGIHFHQ